MAKIKSNWYNGSYRMALKSQTWKANKSQIKRDVYGLIETFRCTFDCRGFADVETMRNPFFHYRTKFKSTRFAVSSIYLLYRK